MVEYVAHFLAGTFNAIFWFYAGRWSQRRDGRRNRGA